MRIRELVMITVWAASAAAAPDGQGAVLKVRVRNTAEVPPQILRRASLEAQRIFHEAGVETEWLLCSRVGGAGGQDAGCQPGPADLYVGILSRSREKEFQIPDSAYGVALLSLDRKQGSFAYVLYGRVEDRVKRAKRSAETVVATETILGHVMAHEVGHLLLGQGHAPRGIMGANWDREALLEAARSRLGFNREQAQRLRLEAGARKRSAEITASAIPVHAN